MKFYCFPKRQTYCSVYSSYSVSKTRLFSNFILQTSPKNSFFFRVRKTYLGHMLSMVTTLDIDVPNQDSEFVGIRKTNKLILVEIIDNIPKWVWKRDKENIWAKEKFLGYQIISEFSIKEFTLQQKIITKALSEHWTNLKKSISNIHGDFTHFNILYDEKGAIHLIDSKKIENSKLYDFFYFYAYLKQSINRDLSISTKEKKKIFQLINSVIKEVCQYDTKSLFIEDFNNMKFSANLGISDQNKKLFLSDFFNLLDI